MAVRELTDEQVNAEIVKHLGLVGRVVKGLRSHGLDHDDLMQEGTIGLREAVLRFDPERNVKFSAYANYWIRNLILKAIIDTGSLVYVPRDISLMRWHYCKGGDACDNAEKVAERAAKLGVNTNSVGRLRDALAVSRTCGMENDHDGLTDPADGPDLERLYAALDALSPDDRDLIRTHYGIGCDPKVLRQIGAERGLTRQRISQMEIRAKQRLAAILNPPEPEPVALPELSPPAPRQRRCKACGAVLVRRKESRQGEQRAFWLARRHCNRACAAITRWEAARATGETAAAGA